ncbi:TPA: hypothetical protein I9094_001039 [Clostridium perfringens]|nr:hypothetical protein [Clostridium perfringens]HAT4338818.1 hypothetical protein [Clostridium perfringens]HAT4344927.1 hypothetical protein [Clostridium perfringens]
MLDKNSKKILDYLKEDPRKEFNLADLLSLGLTISQILECTNTLESKGYIYILSNKRNSSPRYKLRLIKYLNTNGDTI